MFKGKYPSDWKALATACKDAAGWKCIRCNHPNDLPSGHVLTVHHFNGDKSNCEWWNLLALCQRCHLSFQGKVNPETPWMFEHSDWLKPYVAGFYAWKYEGQNLTRSEVEARLNELLNLERVA
jgi:5-methylcytosine-specific restriction endonuclease McrA